MDRGKRNIGELVEMSFDFSNLDITGKVSTGVIALVGTVLGFQRVLTMFKRGKVDGTKVDAEHTIVSSLHEELKRISDELEDARKRQAEMNELIRSQAIKLTRMEVLMIRMYGLITHNNIQMPDDLKNHIDELVKDTK
jgi:hypothetical protein